MPSLKSLVQDAYEGRYLVVTGPHSDWMERLEHEQVPNEKAMHHVVKALLRQYKHPRSGRFSPSSMGECPRKIVFGWAGAPQMPPEAALTEMADHGSFGHLRWQIEGLTMGYMKEAEVWVEDKDMWTGGSMDGDLEDGSIFELKTAAPGVYNRVVIDNRTPKWEHILQVHTYFMLSGKDWASVVYEDRAYGNFHEFRIERDSKVERDVIRRLNGYKRYVEDDVLPPQLDQCEMRMGKTFRGCEYREICHLPKTVSAAQELKGDPERQVPLIEAVPPWAAQMLEYIASREAS